MAKAGQPTKYKPEYCEKLIEHMSIGHSFESFAGIVGVCFDTVYRWSNTHQEFSEAKKKGKAAGLLTLEKMAFAGMAGKLPGWNATTWIFYMKNRYAQYYSDRQQIEISTKPTIIEKIGGGEIILGIEERSEDD